MLSRLLLFFFFLVVTLDALSSKEILLRAEKKMDSSSKSDYFRAYNDYKNLYLRSIMENDEDLKRKALQGIVKSGNKLHIDVKEYAKELKFLKPKKIYIPQTKKPYIKPDVAKKNKKPNKIHKNLNELKSAKFKGDTLVLTFDKNIGARDLNYFSLFDSIKKQYRYVFDMHAYISDTTQKLSKQGIKKIRLGQYKSTILRLVFENTHKINLKFKKQKNKIIITFLNSTELIALCDPRDKPVLLNKNKVIVIDPGHGGKDPGAIGYKKYREKIVVMDIAKKMKSILKARGYKVYMTREKDKFIKLSKRTKYANKKNADIFVSIHANAVDKKNAAKARGVECYFLSKSRSSRAKRVAAKENSADLSDMNIYGKESFLNTLSNHNIIASNKLAIDLQRGMLGQLKKKYSNIHDGGVREGPFWVLVGAQMPSVLVEIGFITNPTEAKRLVKSSYQKNIALGLANGIERYFANCK